MDFQLFVLVFGFLWLALTAVWIYTIVDAVKYSDEAWKYAGQSKMLWVIIIVLVGLIGSILYWVIPRPKLLQYAR